MADPRRIALVALLLPFPAAAQTSDAMMTRGRELTRSCPVEPADAIVICGRIDHASRYRLPLPDEREATPRPSAGNFAATAAFDVPGDCGPSGQRRCTKREALSQGYGGGCDPLSLGLRLGRGLLDPE